MHKGMTPRILVTFVGGILIVFILISLVKGGTIGSAREVAISADTAVYQALTYANSDSPSGKLEGLPTAIHGQLTTYRQATLLTSRGNVTINSNNLDQPAWLIIFTGKVLVHIPGSVDGKIPPKDESYSQMSMTIDAKTGEFLGSDMYAPGDELNAGTLPTLALPVQVPSPPPTIPIRPTTVPEPTFVPSK